MSKSLPSILIVAAAAVMVSPSLHAESLPGSTSSAAVIRNYISLNQRFLATLRTESQEATGSGKTNESSAKLRSEVEAYAENALPPALEDAEKAVCEHADSDLLKATIDLIVQTEESANEEPADTIGRMFICQPDLVVTAAKKESPADRAALVKQIEFGLLNNSSAINSKDREALKQKLQNLH